MNVRNCRKCGKLFNHVMGMPICPACKDALEKSRSSSGFGRIALSLRKIRLLSCPVRIAAHSFGRGNTVKSVSVK